MGAVGCTTTTDPRSRRNRADRRGGQLLTRARSSSRGTACPAFVLPVPRSPDGRTICEDQPILARCGGTKSIMPVTNAIEALNAKLRRAVRVRGHFPSDEAALKLLFLVLNLAEREWRMPPREWGVARAQFVILFDERFQLA